MVNNQVTKGEKIVSLQSGEKESRDVAEEKMETQLRCCNFLTQDFQKMKFPLI